jgi:hypothetical protein
MRAAGYNFNFLRVGEIWELRVVRRRFICGELGNWKVGWFKQKGGIVIWLDNFALLGRGSCPK